MPTIVVLATSYDPGYLAIYEHLVRSERAAGRDVLLLDATRVLATSADGYDRRVLRFFGLAYPGHDLAERARSFGAVYQAMTRAPGHLSALPLDARLEDQLAIAVQSALITFFRTDRPDRRKRGVRRVAEGLEAEGRAIYRGISALLAADPSVALGYVPNGRFPSQKMATMAFHDANLPTRHIEKGEGPGRAYVQNYAPQNRLASQAAVETVLAGLSAEQIDGIADTWMARRAPSADSRNEFSALWSTGLPPAVTKLKEQGGGLVGLFTSSQDEFQFLGPDWQLHDWVDQIEAYDRILREFEVKGWKAYLRVHPNLATKADECFRREREGIRRLAVAHPELVVIWHDDPANSYALTAASDAVVVWDSTVGLEASALGIPVWTSATSRYGLVADIHEVLSADDVARDGMKTWTVDAHQAKRFIAYLVLRDEDITPGEPWVSWQRPNLGVRLATLASAGGAPSVADALRSQVDVYRHRSRRANARALGRR